MSNIEPTCKQCNDTHTMWHGGLERDVMCTSCPTPCQQCRQGGNGPYCSTTPCTCACHAKGKKKPIEPTEEQKQAAHAWLRAPIVTGACDDLARLLAEREAKLQARIDDLTEELAATDTTEMRLRSEVDTLRARVAELEAREKVRDLAAEVDTGEPVDVLLMRTLSARVAELEADVKAAAGELLVEIPEPGSVVARLLLANTAMRRQRDALAGDRVRDAAAMDALMQEREAQHLADIKALMSKRLVDMREAARWGAEISANVDDATDHQIAADIMEEFATFDAEDELLQRLAHYDDAKADADAVSPDCPRESPECITVGFHAVDECERRTSSLPSECPKCQERTHPFLDVELARWLCDRCHHPAGEPFAHDTEGGEG